MPLVYPPLRRCLAGGALIGAALRPAHDITAQSNPVRPDSVRQDSSASVADSLAARLARAEAAIALLQQQLATEASSNVRTRSRLQLELSGRVMTNAYHTSGRSSNAELPLFVREQAVAVGVQGSPGTRAFGVSLRQTLLGAAISVDSVLGGRFIGDIDVDLFAGGTAITADAFAFPELRLRTATARLQWANTSVMVGSDSPLIAELNPVTFAATGTPGFATSGNLWNWIPQARVERTIARAQLGRIPVELAVQGAAMAPVTGVRHAAESDAIDAGERSGRPSLEGRVRMLWGESDAADDARGEIGLGMHRGWLRATGDTLTSTRAVVLNGRIGLTHGMSVLAEGYTGRAVSALGGGGIGQTFGAPRAGEQFGPPVRDVAGWAQFNAQLHPAILGGVGCGSDVADARDRPRRLRNGTCEAHLLWRPTQPVLIGFEVRRLRTVYASGPQRATHFNLAVGFEW